jgi:phosphoglycolate phosphatase
MDISKIKNIIWDFNGTILNDLDPIVEMVNEMMADRDLGSITREEYRDKVSFPVQPFYESLGFKTDEKSFLQLQNEFVAKYHEKMPQMGVYDGVKDLMATFKADGKHQYVLSALQDEILNGHVERLGVLEYMTALAGGKDRRAVGKLEEGRALFEKYQINPNETLMLGDTVMDSDFAKAVGCDCVLWDQGHQSRGRLENTEHPVFSTMAEIKNHLGY